MSKQIPAWIKVLGIDVSHISHKERLVSSLGAFLGIGGILLVTTYYVQSGHAALLVASMGASAVLLFAVPHGTLSQPWPVLGGHVVSAVIGVSIASLVPNEVLAAALAVGGAVGAMHYLRCIHPPGGATAVSAVIGGAEVHELGFQFVLTPVLLNAMLILVIAVLFNFVFEWRRYPAYLQQLHRKEELEKTGDEVGGISHEDFVYALSEMDSFIDVSEDDLLQIYQLATGASGRRHLRPEQIELGHYYSNGKYGDKWSVRHVIDESDERDNTIIYKVVAGPGRRTSGVLDKEEFSRWARYEVYRDEENWRRVSTRDE
jgi:CBS-domain-containing membrane protein